MTLIFFFQLGSDCYKQALPFLRKIFQLLWKTTVETLTSIWVLTALSWVYNANEDDPLKKKKPNQGNLNKFCDQLHHSGKISLVLLLKVDKV